MGDLSSLLLASGDVEDDLRRKKWVLVQFTIRFSSGSCTNHITTAQDRAHHWMHDQSPTYPRIYSSPSPCKISPSLPGGHQEHERVRHQAEEDDLLDQNSVQNLAYLTTIAFVLADLRRHLSSIHFNISQVCCRGRSEEGEGPEGRWNCLIVRQILCVFMQKPGPEVSRSRINHIETTNSSAW